MIWSPGRALALSLVAFVPGQLATPTFNPGWSAASAERAESWRTTMAVTCDGGWWFFGAEYDTETKQIRNLSFNGNRPPQLDFSGDWVLVESSGPGELIASSLNVQQPLTTMNVRGVPIPPAYLYLMVDRHLPTGVGSDKYRIGTRSGVISLDPQAPSRVNQSVLWEGDKLAITRTDSTTGTRVEEWRFDALGRLVVRLSEQRDKLYPIATAAYRRK